MNQIERNEIIMILLARDLQVLSNRYYLECEMSPLLASQFNHPMLMQVIFL